MVTPQRIFALHLAAVAGFVMLYGLTVAAAQVGHERLFGLTALFDIGADGNIPNLFQGLALFAISIVAFSVRKALPRGSQDRLGWAVFGSVFAFMGVDEVARLHENFSAPLGVIGTLGYVVLALMMGLTLFAFWLRQASSIRIGILGAGIVYLIAAVGLEIVELQLLDAGVTYQSLRMELNLVGEEVGEMLAAALFLRTFLARFAELGGGPLVSVVIGASSAKDIQPDPVRTGQALAPAQAWVSRQQ